MSRLVAFSFESVTSAAAEIYVQIKKAIGTVPNTFAAIGGHGSAAFKAVPAADAVPYLHIIVKRSTRYAAVVAAGLVLFGLRNGGCSPSCGRKTRPKRRNAADIALTLACPGRSPATTNGRRSPRRSLYGTRAPAIPPGQRARSEADHLPMLIVKRGFGQLRPQQSNRDG
jgi:hypothetical protein